MNKNTLPKNCRIETIESSRKNRAFYLVFEAPNGNDYRSEIYYPEKGQKLKAAALEICARYGWIEFPPASGILTREELLKLERLVDAAIDDMEYYPERYVPDPDAFWREMFEWHDGEFIVNGNEAMSGDPPVPSPDEDEWTAYNYSYDMRRLIPEVMKDIQVERGPRGIEKVSFHSGDRDGNWEEEAEFTRHQPGVKLTEEDYLRVHGARAAFIRARRAFDAADRQSATYDELRSASREAQTALQVAEALHIMEDDEEYWDPEEFRSYAVQMNCYWTLLRYSRYAIWCALEGKDPLDNVYPDTEQVEAVFEVTACFEGGEVKKKAKRISGEASLRKEAMGYLGIHSEEELRQILKDNPKGRPLSEDRHGNLRFGWEPGKIADKSVTFVVTVKGSRAMPVNAKRIRQVNCKGLQEDVLRMMHQIEKRYPRTNE